MIQLFFAKIVYLVLHMSHSVKSGRIRSYSGLRFSRIFPHSISISPYSVRMKENARKMRTRITPNRDTFYVVSDCNSWWGSKSVQASLKNCTWWMILNKSKSISSSYKWHSVHLYVSPAVIEYFSNGLR